MIPLRVALDIPLRKDEDGVVRVGSSRVRLTEVIIAYLQGSAPEQIVNSFDALKLEDVYLVIAYYLHYRDQVDEYIRQLDREGEDLSGKFETLKMTPNTRALLLAQLGSKPKKE